MASDEVGPSTAEETMDDSAGDETVPKFLHELDNSSFFQDVLPANMEGTKPCIFLELCAGSAKLSFFLQQRSHLQAKKLGEDGVGECHLI